MKVYIKYNFGKYNWCDMKLRIFMLSVSNVIEYVLHANSIAIPWQNIGYGRGTHIREAGRKWVKERTDFR